MGEHVQYVMSDTVRSTAENWFSRLSEMRDARLSMIAKGLVHAEIVVAQTDIAIPDDKENT